MAHTCPAWLHCCFPECQRLETSRPIHLSSMIISSSQTRASAVLLETTRRIQHPSKVSSPPYKYPHNSPFSIVKENHHNNKQSNNKNLTSSMSLIPSFFGGRGRNTNSIFDPFALDVWDPFRDISSLRFPSSDLNKEATAIVNTRVDWKETPEAHHFKVDLPGLKKEEVKVEVEDGRVLQISGERSRENEEKNDKWHRIERSSGKFVRRFQLPENAQMDQIKAAMENGVLTVTVPKVEVKKPEVKTIDISG